jgi:hypothetical protein
VSAPTPPETFLGVAAVDPAFEGILVS